MDFIHPTSGMTLGPEERPGFRSWLPYPPGEPCCEPDTHIRVQRLSIAYQSRPALQHVDLAINRGCVTALVGPSGCGKTSFLMSINRLTDLIQGCRVTGRLHIDEMDVLHPAANLLRLRKMVGMIFQKPTVFPFSIRKNLELPLREHRMSDRTQVSSTIDKVLQQVGLWNEVKDRMDRPAPSLSGGQQQRLCLARALCLEPEILLLDEPCSALDPISSGVVEDCIGALRGQQTIVIVTHNLAQARRIADHVAFFWSFEGVGRLVEYGPARQIFESPKEDLTSAYLAGIRG